MMRIGLFIPCYIDQLFPQVGMATVDLLERLGCEIDFPREQTCCGQPMANTGCTEETRPLALKFFHIFKDYEHVVSPSGSCVAMVRHHFDQYLAETPGFSQLKARTFELCEFLVDVVKVDRLEGSFPNAAWKAAFPVPPGRQRSQCRLEGAQRLGKPLYKGLRRNFAIIA